MRPRRRHVIRFEHRMSTIGEPAQPLRTSAPSSGSPTTRSGSRSSSGTLAPGARRRAGGARRPARHLPRLRPRGAAPPRGRRAGRVRGQPRLLRGRLRAGGRARAARGSPPARAADRPPGSRPPHRGGSRRAAERRSRDERAATTSDAAHDASRAFHLALAAATHNEQLWRLIDGLWIADVGRRLLARRYATPSWQADDAQRARGDPRCRSPPATQRRAEELVRRHDEDALRHWSDRRSPDA